MFTHKMTEINQHIIQGYGYKRITKKKVQPVLNHVYARVFHERQNKGFCLHVENCIFFSNVYFLLPTWNSPRSLCKTSEVCHKKLEWKAERKGK